MVVPFNRSNLRRCLRSTGSPAEGSPASALLPSAPTSHRPSRRTSFPSLGGTVAPSSSSPRATWMAAARRSGVFVFPALHFGRLITTETMRSPRFLGSPNGCMPSLFDPGEAPAPGHWVRACCLPSYPRRRPPQLLHFGAQSRQPTPSLSTLRSRGRPSSTQDSLLGGGQPYPGRIDLRDSKGGFRFYMSSSSSRLGLAHGRSQDIHPPATLDGSAVSRSPRLPSPLIRSPQLWMNKPHGANFFTVLAK